MQKYDENKVDEMVLALMYLGLHDYDRVWKGYDWASLNRLHQKGFILNPVNKAKSVCLTEEGEKMVEHLFKKYFSISEVCSE